MTARPLIVVVVIAGTSCASVPPVETPKLNVAMPPQWTAAAVPTGQIDPDWWNDFGDAGLSEAVEKLAKSIVPAQRVSGKQ